MSNPAPLITLEGPEGAGKTTLLCQLASFLQERDIPHLITREPGGTPTGTRIREVLLDNDSHMQPGTELALFTASRYELVETVIRPALRQGTWVMVDRFLDSTVAYQHYGRGLPEQMVTPMIHYATSGLRPDTTLLLDLPPEAGLQRVAQRGESNRLDQADLEFHLRVREGFLRMAEREPGRFVILDGLQPPAAVAAQALAHITHRHLPSNA